MALTLRRRPAPAQKAPEPEAEENATRSMSVRLSERMHNSVETIKSWLDCDKSEVFRRGIRFLHMSYGRDVRNSYLVIETKDGQKETLPLMKEGRPCF